MALNITVRQKAKLDCIFLSNFIVTVSAVVPGLQDNILPRCYAYGLSGSF